MESPAVELVLFDMDGVVIDSKSEIERFWYSWMSAKGVVCQPNTLHDFVHGRTTRETIQGLFGHLSEVEKEEIVREALAFDLTMRPGLVPGVKPLLEQLASHKVKVGLVTSSVAERVRNILQSLGVEQFFLAMVTAKDITLGKPHPEAYLRMSEKLDVSPDKCLVFEDSVSGITSALRAGMHVVAIQEEVMKAEVLRLGVKRVIPDFSSVSLKGTRPVYMAIAEERFVPLSLMLK